MRRNAPYCRLHCKHILHLRETLKTLQSPLFSTFYFSLFYIAALSSYNQCQTYWYGMANSHAYALECRVWGHDMLCVLEINSNNRLKRACAILFCNHEKYYISTTTMPMATKFGIVKNCHEWLQPIKSHEWPRGLPKSRHHHTPLLRCL